MNIEDGKGLKCASEQKINQGSTGAFFLNTIIAKSVPQLKMQEEDQQEKVHHFARYL